MQQIVRISFSFVFLSFFVLCDNVALDIPKGDACYPLGSAACYCKDARKGRKKILALGNEKKNMLFFLHFARFFVSLSTFY